jgi:hypothetical protein
MSIDSILNQLDPSTMVLIHNLQNNTELNGHIAIVKEYVGHKGRYRVYLGNCKTGLFCRENLFQLSDSIPFADLFDFDDIPQD